MTVEEIISTILLFLGVLLGPAVFFVAVVGYGAKKALSLIAEYRQRRYLRSLPCSKCLYFANSEYLQCAVNPLQVLTDEAQSCHHFELDISQHSHNSDLRKFCNKKFRNKRPSRRACK